MALSLRSAERISRGNTLVQLVDGQSALGRTIEVPTDKCRQLVQYGEHFFQYSDFYLNSDDDIVLRYRHVESPTVIP